MQWDRYFVNNATYLEKTFLNAFSNCATFHQRSQGIQATPHKNKLAVYPSQAPKSQSKSTTLSPPTVAHDCSATFLSRYCHVPSHSQALWFSVTL